MSQKAIFRLLMTLGAMLVAYGFFMDTTVPCGYGDDRCLNMYKQAQQTRYLIGGGIALLAGILLFGFHRLKQSAEDEKREQEIDAAERRARDKRVAESVSGVGRVLSTFLRSIGAQFATNIGSDEYRQRFTTGIVVGSWLVVAFSYAFGAGISVSTFSWLVPVVIGCVAYSLRAMPASSAKRHLWTICTFGTAICFVVSLVYVLMLRAELSADWTPDRFEYSNFVDRVIAAERLLGVMAGGLVAAGIALVTAIRKDRRERDYH